MSDGHQARPARATAQLSTHILPTAGGMIGVCATLIGLVKLYETSAGKSRVDEFSALVAILFLASALFSYTSIRSAQRASRARFERAADACFIIGLVGLAAVSILFAYEVI